MKRPTDLLFLVILLATVLVGTLAPVGGASFQFGVGGGMPRFSESLLLTVGGDAPGPSPELFHELGKINRVVVGRYAIRPKDTLLSVSSTFGSAPDYIRSTNRLSSVQLVPGKTLVVHNGRGMLYQVRERSGRSESIQEIAKKYNLSPVGLAQANRLPGVALSSPEWLEAGRVLFLPTVRLRFTDYLMPVAWARGQRMISSGYGYRRHPVLRVRRFHQGLDMPRPAGSPVRAARDGTVIFAGWRGAFGRLVIIKHEGGLRTWYGHLSSIHVEPGQRVAKGAFIGRVGSSGLATGPHLHFEVRDRFGNALNPKKFLF
ncbi:MAG: M23 family metallopeptidase [Elusimicrobia bacterium]|nr:M23 family metallopeptidase [Elusimicrobiota bacterium]